MNRRFAADAGASHNYNRCLYFGRGAIWPFAASAALRWASKPRWSVRASSPSPRCGGSRERDRGAESFFSASFWIYARRARTHPSPFCGGPPASAVESFRRCSVFTPVIFKMYRAHRRRGLRLRPLRVPSVALRRRCHPQHMFRLRSDSLWHLPLPSSPLRSLVAFHACRGATAAADRGRVQSPRTPLDRHLRDLKGKWGTPPSAHCCALLQRSPAVRPQGPGIALANARPRPGCR